MRRVRWVAVVAAFGMIGCGGDGLRRVPVNGTVTAKGVAVNNATVLFLPAAGTKGEGGIGTTDGEGQFTLTGSRQGEKGVVPGKYRVRVSRFVDHDGSVLPADAKQADFPHAVESVPAPYSAPDSPLEVEVPDKGGTVNVEVPVKLRGKTKG
jgi:hypothetical protein